MKHLKGLQRTAILSAAIATLAFGGHQAKAFAPFVPTPAGSCVGSAGVDDCVTAVGHISGRVVGTLTINETRAVSFGNFAVATNLGGGIITMSDTGVEPRRWRRTSAVASLRCPILASARLPPVATSLCCSMVRMRQEGGALCPLAASHPVIILSPLEVKIRPAPARSTSLSLMALVSP